MDLARTTGDGGIPSHLLRNLKSRKRPGPCDVFVVFDEMKDEEWCALDNRGRTDTGEPTLSAMQDGSDHFAWAGRDRVAMMTKPKAWLSWSSGKDSAWALQITRELGNVEVVALLTTVNTTHARVAMHAVREVLLEQQALAAGLPLVKIPLPWPCSNEVYEQEMKKSMMQARAEGITYIVFGDLFLEDIRRYREVKLASCNITPLFPVWRKDTENLAREMIDAGLQAYLTCIDPKKLDASFASRRFDASLLEDLPRGVDPCGENGEFHTFACAGPMFNYSIPVECGEVLERDGFVFADLCPACITDGRS